MSETLGLPRLGQKTASLQQPSALGQEFDIVSSDYDATDDVFINLNGGTVRVKWLRNASGAPLVPGTVVKRDVAEVMAHDVETAGAGEPGCAIVDPFLTSNVADGEMFLGVIKGEIDVRCSAVIAVGAQLNVAALGEAVGVVVSTAAHLISVFGVATEVGADNTLSKAIVDFTRVL